jgi:hypothetical protein
MDGVAEIGIDRCKLHGLCATDLGVPTVAVHHAILTTMPSFQARMHASSGTRAQTYIWGSKATELKYTFDIINIILVLMQLRGTGIW